MQRVGRSRWLLYSLMAVSDAGLVETLVPSLLDLAENHSSIFYIFDVSIDIKNYK